MNLNDLALKYNNDKSSDWLNYMVEYEKYFSSLKKKDISILELGVGGGTSLKIWYDYFKNAKSMQISRWDKKNESKKIQVFGVKEV